MALEPAPLAQLRRKELTTAVLNEFKKSVLLSLNCSLVWLGTTLSLFCSAVTSRLHQRVSNVHVPHSFKRNAAIGEIKRPGSTISFARSNDNLKYLISVLVLTATRRSSDSAQIFTIYGLSIESLDQNFDFHIVSWTLHKSKHPVRPIAAGDTTAAAKHIDEGLVLK